MKTLLGIPLTRPVIGWAFYDFANSSFVTVIMTVVFSVYFKETVVGDGELGTALWGWATGFSMLLTALSMPILGAVADRSGKRKRYLVLFTGITVVFTALLYCIGKGDIVAAIVLVIIANYAFNSANVFYNAFLIHLGRREYWGRISGLGWGFGYVGGLLSLLGSLWLYRSGMLPMVFPFVALFFLTFAMITFRHLPEPPQTDKKEIGLRGGYRRLLRTLSRIRRFPVLLRFLLAYFLYNDGITVVILFSSIYGATRFGMDAAQLITYFIIAQFTSIAGAFGFGFITDRLGARKTITITLILWILVVLGAYFAPDVTSYYIVGLVAGIAIGSSQASSRTLMGYLTPPAHATEFFAFYSFSGRLTSVLGPAIYGMVSWLTGSQRNAILAVLLFFVAGLVVLTGVDERKGHRDATSWE